MIDEIILKKASIEKEKLSKSYVDTTVLVEVA